MRRSIVGRVHADGDTAAREVAPPVAGTAPEQAVLAVERDRLLAIAATTPALEAEAERLRRRIDGIERSALWRGTFPLRFARKLVVKRYWIAFRAARWLKDRWEP
jgi:hypothetical protein